MAEIDVQEAAQRLSHLLQRAAAGEEIVIAREGRPVARLVPVDSTSKRVIGQDEGLFEVPEDFDTPLPQDALAPFER